ncbi:hypothetical protein HK405_015085, partial [Cladochytrium tenue]
VVELFHYDPGKAMVIFYVTGSLHVILWTIVAYVYHVTLTEKREKLQQRQAATSENAPDPGNSDEVPRWLRPAYVNGVAATVVAVGLGMFLRVHSYAGRYVVSVKVRDGGRRLEIRNARLVGRRRYIVDAEAVHTSRPAFTGRGPTGTDPPPPPPSNGWWGGLPTPSALLARARDAAVPLHAPQARRASLWLERSGRFVDPRLWDQLFLRVPSSSPHAEQSPAQPSPLPPRP